MKRIRLITASFGHEPKQLRIRTPLVYKDYSIDIIAYNDDNTPSREKSLLPRTKGKIPKMMEWFDHPDYDYYIWIDSKFTILEGFLDHMMEYENDEDAQICLFKHPYHNSIKQEMDFMRDHMNNGDDYLISRYEGEIMEDKVNEYLADPSFKDDKFFYCGLFMYSKKLVENRGDNIMKDWLLHCIMYNTHDQLWFCYLLQKHKIKYRVYSQHLLKNNFLRYV